MPCNGSRALFQKTKSELHLAGQRLFVYTNCFYSATERKTWILVFSHFSERDDMSLLRSIADALQDSKLRMAHVIISTYDERIDGVVRIGIASSCRIVDEERTDKTYRSQSEKAFLAYAARAVCRVLEGIRSLGHSGMPTDH